LWRFIEAELESASIGDYAPHLRQELLKKGGLLLLDGLDEVPEADQRRIQIKQTVEDFAATCKHCRVLVTSRTYAYQKQDWRLPNFAEAVLALGERPHPSQPKSGGQAGAAGRVFEPARRIAFAARGWRLHVSAPHLSRISILKGNESRVVRGGAFHNEDWHVRCAFRHWRDPGHRLNHLGFRVAVLPFNSGL
jgi:hypothetical protein